MTCNSRGGGTAGKFSEHRFSEKDAPAEDGVVACRAEIDRMRNSASRSAPLAPPSLDAKCALARIARCPKPKPNESSDRLLPGAPGARLPLCGAAHNEKSTCYSPTSLLRARLASKLCEQ